MTLAYPNNVKTPTEQMTGLAPGTVSEEVLTRTCDECGSSYSQPLDPWGYIPCCQSCADKARWSDAEQEDHYDNLDALMDGHC